MGGIALDGMFAREKTLVGSLLKGGRSSTAAFNVVAELRAYGSGSMSLSNSLKFRSLADQHHRCSNQYKRRSGKKEIRYSKNGTAFGFGNFSADYPKKYIHIRFADLKWLQPGSMFPRRIEANADIR